MIITGDMLDVLATMDVESFDACVTDAPYHLTSIVKRFGGPDAAPAKTKETGAFARASRGFMGQTWDGGDVAFRVETWEAVWRVMKPGAYLVAFSGTRTYHRMVCAIEDAGFEIRDQLAWVYGTGFPKSRNISLDMDKAAGAQREFIPTGNAQKRMIPGADQDSTGSWIKDNGRTYQPGLSIPATDAAKQWVGWGTALKPAWEPIVLARKPLIGTVAQNVLTHGTGAINIDACRVHAPDALGGEYTVKRRKPGATMNREGGNYRPSDPNAKLFHGSTPPGRHPANILHDGEAFELPNDAQRFFYSAKAGKTDRAHGNDHPTVKPRALMEWLCKLVTPPGGRILDPFAGSGSTGFGARAVGGEFVGIELLEKHAAIARRRLGLVTGGDLFGPLTEAERSR